MSTYPTISIQKEWDLDRNASTLANKMQQERKANALSGFWFDFGEGESVDFKRYSNRVWNACWEFARNAKNRNRRMQLFKNMNGQIAVRYVD